MNSRDRQIAQNNAYRAYLSLDKSENLHERFCKLRKERQHKMEMLHEEIKFLNEMEYSLKINKL